MLVLSKVAWNVAVTLSGLCLVRKGIVVYMIWKSSKSQLRDVQYISLNRSC